MLGAEPVAWLVIVTSFTAEAVLTNLMYSLFESSSIAPPCVYNNVITIGI
jgi:hypothetical protein